MSRSLTLPSARILTAAEMAAVSLYPNEKTPHFALDVGCDHAKLSAYLVQSGICKGAVASDINEGPVEKARVNLRSRKFGGKTLDNYIEVVKTDGLRGLENKGADRIFVLGMGGELIASILDKADFLKNDENKGKIGLVLQPMTSEDALRKYLAQNGFEIRDENLVFDKNRVYAVMLAVFDGVKRNFTQAEYLLGRKNIEKHTELFSRQLERRIRITKNALSEIKSADIDNPELEELYKQLCDIKEMIK